MKEVEQQLRDSAGDRGLLKIQSSGQDPIITTTNMQSELIKTVINVAINNLKPWEPSRTCQGGNKLYVNFIFSDFFWV